jgi:hypothetical protein
LSAFAVVVAKLIAFANVAGVGDNVDVVVPINGVHRHLSNMDCLSFAMCPLLALLVIGFFSFFFYCSHLQY